MKLLRVLLYFCLGFSVSGCVSGAARVEEQNQSLQSIRQAIIGVIGEPRSVSSNQRVYISEYYGRKTDKKFNPQKSKFRQYSRISILGDRRPYDIDVDVVVEQKNGLVYEEEGVNEDESVVVANALRDRLHQGLDGRNIIDDFRIF